MITQQRLKFLLSYDKPTGILTWINKTSTYSKNCIGERAGYSYKGALYKIVIDGKKYSAACLAVLYETGVYPYSGIVHLDSDPLNDSWDNLEVITSTTGLVIDAAFANKFFSYEDATGDLSWKCSVSKTILKGTLIDCQDKDGYIVVGINYKLYKAHRIIFLLKEGRWPTTLDHVNRVPSDNRWKNLREVTTRQNTLNRGPQKNNKLGLKNICFRQDLNKYEVRVQVEGKCVTEHYTTLVDAKEAAIRLRKELHGEYAAF